jgi:hypothetical protein
MLFQETVQPLGDLRYMLENYRTGPFVPRVTTYENYYNSVDGTYECPFFRIDADFHRTNLRC